MCIRPVNHDAPVQPGQLSTQRAGSAQLTARAIVLAGVQQQLVNTSQLREALSRRGPCRHRALIIESVLDAAGGIQSLPERDVDRIRRRCGLPRPARQAAVRRPDGRYYLDMEWLEYGAAVEIHGIPHLAVRQWERDLARANEIVIHGARLLVFSSYAVRHEPVRVGNQLVRLLRRGGWAG
jgi:very-short-patch-repair endonuclease